MPISCPVRQIQLTQLADAQNARIDLVLTDKEGQELKVHQTEPTEPIRYLGVHQAGDGSWKGAAEATKKICDKFARLLPCCPIGREGATTAYYTVFLPAVRYPFPLTSVPWTTLESLQCQVTSVFLSQMGYNRNMPRAVVFGPKQFGGLGLAHLAIEQGLSQVCFLLQHIRCKKTTKSAYQIALDWYQLAAGISKPILEDTRPLPYIVGGQLIDSLRSFLHMLGAKVTIEKKLDHTTHARRRPPPHGQIPKRTPNNSRAR
jgi:hypothetical protein